MQKLSKEEIARWTRGFGNCDFSDFSIPTTDTAPWGEFGQMVRVALEVDPEKLEPSIVRTVLDGTWDRQKHGLVIPMPTRREPERIGLRGLYGLVSVSLESVPMWNPSGFIVHGQSLVADEEKLLSLVTRLAAAELDRIIGSYSAVREGLLRSFFVTSTPHR